MKVELRDSHESVGATNVSKKGDAMDQLETKLHMNVNLVKQCRRLPIRDYAMKVL